MALVLSATLLLLLLFGVLGTILATYIYDTVRSAVEEVIPYSVLSSAGGADAAILSRIHQ